MKVQTTKEQIEKLEAWCNAFARAHDAQHLYRNILADLKTLHAEAEREQRLERIGRTYKVWSAPSQRREHWVATYYTDNLPPVKLGQTLNKEHDTRRLCDDTILEAVKAHEAKEAGQ